MAINQAQRERAALSDLFDELGPDVPTLCGDWDARDLAAHLVVRERRPDAALGILAPPFERYGDKVRRQYAEGDFAELVDQVRNGPPTLSLFGLEPVDRAANTMEYFIHHEDVRRPAGMGPRDLEPDLERQLWDILKRVSRLFLRKAPAGVELRTDDGRSYVAHRGDPMVTVSGAVGELALFVYGRQTTAQVECDGPDDAVAALLGASFGP